MYLFKIEKWVRPTLSGMKFAGYKFYFFYHCFDFINYWSKDCN